MESASDNSDCCCASGSDARMAQSNGTTINISGTYSCIRAPQIDLDLENEEENCTKQSLATSESADNSSDASLEVTDTRVNNNTNDANMIDTNDAATNQCNRLGKPQQPLLTLNNTASEDILLNELPSLNIHSSSSILSPSSILSDSTVEDDVVKSPTSSAQVIDHYHDHHLHNNHEAQTMAQDLASEHRIFLRAALDMLTERDQLRMYADVNDPNNIIKTGTLRKASHHTKVVWKTKHVEIRDGVFSYSSSGSSSNNNSSSRKDVLLRASSCTCRAVKKRSVKIRPSNFGNGFVFELKIQGGSRRLWMANTREERQSWMQAIHSAMVGASVTRSDNFLQYHIDSSSNSINNNNNTKRKGNNTNKLPLLNSPYQPYLEQYIKVGEACARAKTKAEYLLALAPLRGKTITVPVQWIKSQLDDTPAGASAFLENDISSCVEQLWKDLVRDSVEINGHVLTGESFHGPDRIVGRLTQQILFSDRSQNNKSDVATNRITESQSVLYARNILLGADRTRTGGDSYYCAENLCTNRNLVVICPSSTEANPLSITVHASSVDDERCHHGDSPTELSGRVSTRSSSDEPWKKMLLVLSENSIHFYDESDTNRCISLHNMDLTGAKVTNSTNCAGRDSHTIGHVITVVTSEEGLAAQEFLFEDEFDFLLWRSSLEKAVVDCRSNGKHLPDKTLLNGNAKQRSVASTVDVSVNVSTEYKMCTLDPQGVESEDTWGTIRTTFKQQFRLSGGPSGRIFRGDEVVQLELL